MSNKNLETLRKLRVLSGLEHENYALKGLYENSELLTDSEEYPVIEGKQGPFLCKNGDVKYYDPETNTIEEGKKRDVDGDIDSDDYLAAKDKAIKKAKKEDMKEESCGDDHDDAKEESVNEAEDATAINNLMNIDDEDYQKDIQGIKQAQETKIEFPAEIKKSIDNRISELKKAIELYDEKGYNDGSLKPNAIEVLEKIKEKLSEETYEGFKQAQMLFQRLMNPITSLLPSKLINFLATGDQKQDDGVLKEV